MTKECEDRPEKPLPPALAYWCVVEAIADHTWFLRPQPEKGIRLIVAGVDHVGTSWDFDEVTGARVMQRLHFDGRVRRIKPAYFDNARTPPA